MKPNYSIWHLSTTRRVLMWSSVSRVVGDVEWVLARGFPRLLDAVTDRHRHMMSLAVVSLLLCGVYYLSLAPGSTLVSTRVVTPEEWFNWLLVEIFLVAIVGFLSSSPYVGIQWAWVSLGLHLVSIGGGALLASAIETVEELSPPTLVGMWTSVAAITVIWIASSSFTSNRLLWGASPTENSDFFEEECVEYVKQALKGKSKDEEVGEGSGRGGVDYAALAKARERGWLCGQVYEGSVWVYGEIAPFLNYSRPLAFRWPIRLVAALCVGLLSTILAYVAYEEGADAISTELQSSIDFLTNLQSTALQQLDTANGMADVLSSTFGLNATYCASLEADNSRVSTDSTTFFTDVTARPAPKISKRAQLEACTLMTSLNATASTIQDASEMGSGRLLSALEAAKDSYKAGNIIALVLLVLQWFTFLPHAKILLVRMRKGGTFFPKPLTLHDVRSQLVLREDSTAPFVRAASHSPKAPFPPPRPITASSPRFSTAPSEREVRVTTGVGLVKGRFVVPSVNSRDATIQIDPTWYGPDRATFLLPLVVFNTIFAQLLAAIFASLLVFALTYQPALDAIWELIKYYKSSLYSTAGDYAFRYLVLRIFIVDTQHVKLPALFSLFEVAYMGYSSLSGLVVAVLRLVYGIALGVLVLIRPDLRLLPVWRWLDSLDSAYLSTLIIYHSHNNPIVRTFTEEVVLKWKQQPPTATKGDDSGRGREEGAGEGTKPLSLQTPTSPSPSPPSSSSSSPSMYARSWREGDKAGFCEGACDRKKGGGFERSDSSIPLTTLSSPSSTSSASKRRRISFKWQLAYTLLRNPSIRKWRKDPLVKYLKAQTNSQAEEGIGV